VYQEWKKFDKSFEFHQRALVISDSTNNKFGKAYSQINLGNFYIHNGKYDTALEFYYKAYKNYKADNHIVGVSMSLKHIGDIYKEKKDYEKSLKYYKRSFASADSVNSRRRVTIALYATAEIYALQGNLNKALNMSQKSLEIALNEKYRDDLAKNYALIASIYERQKKYKESLVAYKLSKVWQDSLFNQEKMNEFTDLQVRFNVAQKDKENELLRKDNEIQRLNYAREYSLRNSFLAIILLAIIVVVLLILRHRMSQKTNKILQQQNDEIRAINKEKEMLIVELQQALANVKELNGLLPICSSCKKIRDDKGYWNEVEKYVSSHTDAQFSHGLCPECFDETMKELNAV
jgi:tetratricopeptide (TPR) repeat protein